MPKICIDTVDVDFKSLKLHDTDSSGKTNYPTLEFVFSCDKRLSKSMLGRLRLKDDFQDYFKNVALEHMESFLQNKNQVDRLIEAMNLKGARRKYTYSTPRISASIHKVNDGYEIHVTDLLFASKNPIIKDEKDIMEYVKTMVKKPIKMSVN